MTKSRRKAPRFLTRTDEVPPAVHYAGNPPPGIEVGTYYVQVDVDDTQDPDRPVVLNLTPDQAVILSAQLDALARNARISEHELQERKRAEADRNAFWERAAAAGTVRVSRA
jgi:hypothetical protein